MKAPSLLSALVALPMFVIACSSAPEPGNDSADVVGSCEEGDTKACKCSGKSGSKTCSDDGKWGACDCEEEEETTKSTTAPAPASEAPKPVCAELSSCESLTAPGSFTAASGLDVNLAAISKAQILENLRVEVAAGSPRARYLAAALAAPKASEEKSVTFLREQLDANLTLRAAITRQVTALGFGALESYRDNFPVVTTSTAQLMEATVPGTCSPALRIRLAKITVTEEDDDIANDEIYCSISAQAKDVQELKITPKTRPLNEGESQAFTADQAVVWGQGKPREPGGDLTLKYDCFETDSAGGYGAFVKAAADAAKKYGTKVVSTDNAGYVSTGADLVSTFLPQILALDSDDHLFVATQTIPVARHMELAKGATWTLRKSGTNLWSDWDWSLTMESFGCATNGAKVDGVK